MAKETKKDLDMTDKDAAEVKGGVKKVEQKAVKSLKSPQMKRNIKSSR